MSNGLLWGGVGIPSKKIKRAIDLLPKSQLPSSTHQISKPGVSPLSQYNTNNPGFVPATLPPPPDFPGTIPNLFNPWLIITGILSAALVVAFLIIRRKKKEKKEEW